MFRLALRRWLSVLVFGAALGFADAAPTSLSGHLTTTEDQALYGVAVLRSKPAQDAAVVGKLTPGSRVTVYPETSPPNWWYAVLVRPDGVETVGFVPRNFVKMSRGPLPDVPADHWAADALRRLKASGDLRQKETFEGGKAFDRFELAWVLDRALSRARETKRAIDAELATLPEKIELTKEVADRVTHLMKRSKELVAEQAALSEKLLLTSVKVEDQAQRLNGLDVTLTSMTQRDVDQERRVAELIRTASRLTAEVAVLKKRQSRWTEAPQTEFVEQARLAGFQIEAAVNKTAGLEARVVAAEAFRDEGHF